MLNRLLLIPLCCAWWTPPLAAQAEPSSEIFLPVRYSGASFSLSPAGARSLGLGGAFVAVADDPSAADANPAGLAQIERPQLLTSLRTASFDTEFEDGFAPGPTTTSERVTGPAFVGYVHPTRAVTLAAYYQQDARYRSAARFALGDIILPVPSLAFGIDERRFDQRLETVGIAASRRLGSAVSIGAALRYQRLTLDWVDAFIFGEAFLIDPPPILPPAISGFTTVADDDADLTAALGLLVHPGGRWTGGLSYQQGGSYDLVGEAVIGIDPRSLALVRPLPFDLPVHLPDVASAGVAFRPSERWLVSGQVSHLTYSDLDPGPQFGILESEILDLLSALSPYRGDEPLKDRTQVHLGAEWRLRAAGRPLNLRAGAWSDPDHDGTLRQDGDQVHAALGAGTSVGERWGLDGAVRFSERTAEGVLALGYSF